MGDKALIACTNPVGHDSEVSPMVKTCSRVITAAVAR